MPVDYLEEGQALTKQVGVFEVGVKVQTALFLF